MDKYGGSVKPTAMMSNMYRCEVCQVSCISAMNLQTHFLGQKHKQVEAALKARVPDNKGTLGEERKIESGCKNLQEYVDSCGLDSPVIGLDFVTEHQDQSGKVLHYECALCSASMVLSGMIMHVVGNKHRYAYMKMKYPNVIDEIERNCSGRKSDFNKEIKEKAAAVERMEGKKRIKVVVTYVEPSKRKATEVNEPDTKRICHDDHLPYIAERNLGDQSDQFGPGFDDLMALDKQKARENETPFQSNEELLDYLQKFQLRCEADTSFVVKVIQGLTDSLMEYRLRKLTGSVPSTDQKSQKPFTASEGYSRHDSNSTDPGKVNWKGGAQRTPDPSCSAAASASSFPPNGSRSPETGYPAGDGNWNRGPARCSSGASLDRGSLHDSAWDARTREQAAKMSRSIIPPEMLRDMEGMDISQVTAVLSRIAATNPAFRGINIPAVINILVETGALRP
ncbi:uncharacterized protein LOC102365864 isoform X1 [Latimeria chalumnae]|uniref:uncharacterized protein LOC102365864 isoform X1 n=1 Tax=Latimeria chalumnae TaxID=7897 RepID=UPI00313DDCAF